MRSAARTRNHAVRFIRGLAAKCLAYLRKIDIGQAEARFDGIEGPEMRQSDADRR
jgi:hypothetical protein